MHAKNRIVQNSFSSGKAIATVERVLDHDCSSHYHNFYEMDIVLGGSGSSICNGEEFPIQRGMITFLSPEGLHSFSPEEPMHEINIQFTLDAVDPSVISFLSSVKNNVTYVSEQVLCSIYSLFSLLHSAESITDAKGYSSKLLECIILSFQDRFERAAAKESKASSAMQNAVVYIHSHFKEDPKMREVAEHLYLNENYFSRSFKRTMGISYKEYLRILKLEHAKRLLIYTDLPITQISYDSGYNSQSHFNRDFKSYYGMSPAAMRKSMVMS